MIGASHMLTFLDVCARHRPAFDTCGLIFFCFCAVLSTGIERGHVQIYPLLRGKRKIFRRALPIFLIWLIGGFAPEVWEGILR